MTAGGWWAGADRRERGLAGEEIPYVARILAVADAYDAMTSARPHRPALTLAEAAAELRRCAGTQFDPVYAEALLVALARGQQPRASTPQASDRPSQGVQAAPD